MEGVVISGAPPIQFPIDGQLDQSIDESMGAPPGTLVDLVNLRRDKVGRLVKREGYARLAHSAEQAATVRMLARGAGVAVIDRRSVAVYTKRENIVAEPSWAPSWALDSARTIDSRPGASNDRAGCCSADGYTFHVFVDAQSDPTLIVTEELTGNVVRGPERLTSNSQLVRITTDGENVWVATITSAAVMRGWCKTVTEWVGGQALGTEDWTDTGSGAFYQFDLCNLTNNRAAIVFNVTGGYELYVVDQAFAVVVGSTQSPGNIVTLSMQAIAQTHLMVGYVLASATTATIANLHLGTSAALLDSVPGPVTSTDVSSMGFAGTAVTAITMVATETGPSSALPRGIVRVTRLNWDGVNLTDLHSAAHHIHRSVRLASYPFAVDGDVFAWCEVGQLDDDYLPHNSLVLTQFTEAGTLQQIGSSLSQYSRPHIRVAAGVAQIETYAIDDVTPSPQKVYRSSITGGQYVWAGLVRPAALEADVGTVEYRFTAAAPNRNAMHVGCEATGLAVTCGGAPHAFDGSTMTELGFCYAPPVASVSTSSSGGLIVAGSYQYALTYEYTDRAGLRHQSAPRILETVVTHASGTLNSASVAAHPLRVTNKHSPNNPELQENVQITVWRTKAGPGSIFYRVAVTGNDPRDVDTIAIADTFSDETIEENEILYTSLGELANEMPPALRHVVVFNNRLAGIEAEHDERIVFSKPMRIGRGPEFSSALETYVRGIGRLTALAEIDGTLYAFSESAVAVAAYGDGQDATGGGGWPQPQVVSRGAGAVDARAVCVTQDGILFVCGDGGRKRIWLMPRGSSNPIEVGRKVRRYLDGVALSSVTSLSFTSTASPSVVAMVNNPARGRVTIWLRASQTARTFALEYDYLNKTEDGIGSWNARVGLPDMIGVSSAVVADDRIFLGTETAIGAGARMFASDESLYIDQGYSAGSEAAEDINWRIQLADLKPSQTPSFKVNSIVTTFEEHEAETIQQSASQDGGQSFVTNSWAFASVTSGRLSQRHWEPPLRRSDKGTGLRLAWTSFVDDLVSADSEGVIPRAVAIELIPFGDVYLPMSSERA